MVKMVTLMLLTYLICDGMPYVHFYFEMYHSPSLKDPNDDRNKRIDTVYVVILAVLLNSS